MGLIFPECPFEPFESAIYIQYLHMHTSYSNIICFFQKFQCDCMSSKEWKPWQQVGQAAVQEGGVGGRPGARGGKVEEKVGKVEKVEVKGGKMIQ